MGSEKEGRKGGWRGEIIGWCCFACGRRPSSFRKEKYKHICNVGKWWTCFHMPVLMSRRTQSHFLPSSLPVWVRYLTKEGQRSFCSSFCYQKPSRLFSLRKVIATNGRGETRQNAVDIKNPSFVLSSSLIGQWKKKEAKKKEKEKERRISFLSGNEGTWL